MAAVGRNEPCPCGSGRKAKRCCGSRRGPSDDAVAAAFLSAAVRRVAPLILVLGRDGIMARSDELYYLPTRHLSLLVPLPDVFTPAFERFCAAMRDDRPDEAEGAMPDVYASYNRPTVKAQLARNVLELGDRGEVSAELAAIAVADLAQDESSFLRASIVHTTAMLAGVSRTPGGLVLAQR